MENNLETTIKNLKKLIRDSNCQKMNLSTVKGYLGELMVRKKLMEESKEVIHKGNQSNYDLKVDNYLIDVKLSSLKEEIKYFNHHWGWALNHTNKKRKISCTHFVLVALNKKYNVENFFIIKANDVEKFPSGIGQFRSKKCLCFFTIIQ